MKHLYLAACLFLFGCSHLPEKPATDYTAEKFWNEQISRRKLTEKFSGKATIHFTGREESGTGKGQLVSQPSEQFRLEIRDPLGRLQYLATLNGKAFGAQISQRKLAYIDPKAGALYLKLNFGMPFSFHTLRALLVGLLPEKSKVGTFQGWNWDSRMGCFQTQTSIEGVSATLWINGDNGTLRRVDLKGDDGLTQIVYEDFAPCCSKTMQSATRDVAQLIHISVEKRKTYLDIDWQEIKPFDDLKPASIFQAQVPVGFKKIVLE